MPTRHQTDLSAQETTDLKDKSEVAIYRRLREDIAEGRYEPGDRLPAERELSEAFDVSRGVVRRAVQRLEREGRVVRHVGRGTFVFLPQQKADLSQATGRHSASPLDILEARMVIEPGFADLIVARATTSDFANLEAKLDKMAAARSQQEFRELGYQFHSLLAQATRNPLVIHLFEQIVEARVAAGWGRLKSLNSRSEDRERQVAANRAVLEALRMRDGERSRKLLRDHLGQMVASIAYQTNS